MSTEHWASGRNRRPQWTGWPATCWPLSSATARRYSAAPPARHCTGTPRETHAYPSLDAKAAALLHSLVRNYALIDGNKRLALAAAIAFYGLNGRRLTLPNDQAYDLVMKVAAGELDQAEEIAAILQGAQPAADLY